MDFKIIIVIVLCFILANSVLALKPTFIDPINPGGGGGISGFEAMLIKIMSWLWPISIVVAVLMIIVGAYYFIFSGGDPTKVATAKKVVTYALLGLVILASAIGIWNLVKLILGV
ncbi:hypothetical protein KKC63_00630 [Patescibacteria group bacterium]|nr:hypothetical protein [Patescibacteria group bacterium]MBU4023332.1 hypothetical protein [Patescibacteria group bacterium]